MGLFSKLKEHAETKKQISVRLSLVEGLPMPRGNKTFIIVDPKTNEMKFGESLFSLDNLITLNMDKVNFVETSKVSEVLEKDKSVLKRAAVGTLLGPVGAIVGGMSGIGSKKKEKNNRIIVIGYMSDGEQKQITFMDGKGTTPNGIWTLEGEVQKYLNDKENKGIEL